MSVILRTICDKDLDNLYMLNQVIFSDLIKYDKNYFSTFCLKGHGKILLEYNKPIGYIIYGYTCSNCVQKMTIISLGVLKEYRNKGYGDVLIKESIKTLKEHNEIILHVMVNNMNAIKLYKTNGFVIIKRLSNYYYQLNTDAFIMQKINNR